LQYTNTTPLGANNKILNNNIIVKNSSLFNNSEKVLNDKKFIITKEEQKFKIPFQKQKMNLDYYIKKKQIEDFREKFFESNLDKIISWEELEAIALAIDSKDWEYVKYILTIICLMLKSYQNINEESKTTEKEEIIRIKNQSDNIGNESNTLIIPEKRYVNKTPQVQFTKNDIQDQLMSLNNLFKKMKKIDIQMNISNCWNCHNKICGIHNMNSHLENFSNFNKKNQNMFYDERKK
jgi:hypothetical protein